MPDALLDIIGVVPVQLVFASALTMMLNIRRLSLFWVLERRELLALAREYGLR